MPKFESSSRTKSSSFSSRQAGSGLLILALPYCDATWLTVARSSASRVACGVARRVWARLQQVGRIFNHGGQVRLHGAAEALPRQVVFLVRKILFVERCA